MCICPPTVRENSVSRNRSDMTPIRGLMSLRAMAGDLSILEQRGDAGGPVLTRLTKRTLTHEPKMSQRGRLRDEHNKKKTRTIP